MGKGAAIMDGGFFHPRGICHRRGGGRIQKRGESGHGFSKRKYHKEIGVVGLVEWGGGGGGLFRIVGFNSNKPWGHLMNLLRKDWKRGQF